MGRDTVLIVEDNIDLRRSLQLLFEEEGYDTILAHDGRVALDLILELSGPTVILLDLVMPRLDGYCVLRHLAAHPEGRDDYAVFLLTANMDQISSDMAWLLGVQGVSVFPKPFDIDRLIGEVRGAFARHGTRASITRGCAARTSVVTIQTDPEWHRRQSI